MKNITEISVTPKELKEVLIKAARKGLPVLIKGAPGIGKTDIVTQAAKELKMDLIVCHPVVSDPTDAKGLPAIVDGKAEFLPFGDLRKMMQATKRTIVFLDDLGQAPAVVQASFMQLILARQINGKKISDKIVFFAATNRRQDRAGVTSILEPVKSRFATILGLKADADEWSEWAHKNDMPAELIGFIHFRPSLLNTEEATADIVNHPCPRTIASAGRLIQAGLNSMAVLAGAVGHGCAVELVGFLRVYSQLPDINGILSKPKKEVVPEDPAALYAVTAALTDKATLKTVKAIFTYSERMPAEFRVLLMKSMIQRNIGVEETDCFRKWVLKNKELFVR